MIQGFANLGLATSFNTPNLPTNLSAEPSEFVLATRREFSGCKQFFNKCTSSSKATEPCENDSLSSDNTSAENSRSLIKQFNQDTDGKLSRLQFRNESRHRLLV